MTNTEKQVLAFASSQVGVKEIGLSNTGKSVQMYTAVCGYPKGGVSWCACFIAWVLKQALAATGQPAIWLNSAGCDQILNWARDHNILRSSPAPGCVGLVMKTNTDATHIFIVEEVHAAGGLTTLEGNTNKTGAAQGDGVYRLTHRNANQKRSGGGPKYVWVDWARLLPAFQASVAGYFLFINDRQVTIDNVPLVMPLVANKSYVPLERLGEYLGLSYGFDLDDQTPYYFQQADVQRRQYDINAPITKLHFGLAADLLDAAPIRPVSEGLGLVVAVDPKRRAVVLTRPKGS